MIINKKIHISLSILFITLICAGCNKNINNQTKVKESNNQTKVKESNNQIKVKESNNKTVNNSLVDEPKKESTEQSSEVPPALSIEPLIILKDKIHPSLPEYTFKVYGQKNDTLYSANKIEIYNGAEKKENLQELNFNDTSTPDAINLGIVIEDMNFDGYKDIRIQQFLPASANVPYYYWLWDSVSSKFVKNVDLEIITSPVFDFQSKSIKSNAKSGAATYYDYEYKYIGGNITLIKETEKIGDLEKKVWHVTIKELIDNEMKVTKEYDEEIQ